MVCTVRPDERPKLTRRYTADEYIDDLPLRDEEVYSKAAENASPDTSPPVTDTQPIERVAIRPGGVVKSLVSVALLATGWAAGSLQYTVFRDEERDIQVTAPPTVEPAPTVTVTVTEQVNRLPESCKKAMRDMGKYLDAAAAVGNAHSHQLDIISDAYVAIQLRDWKKLNDLTDRQRQLGRTLGPASSAVLPVLVDVRKGMAQCQSDAS